MIRFLCCAIFGLAASGAWAAERDAWGFAPEDQPLSVGASQSSPWTDYEANSDFRHPMYIGATPRQLVLHGVKETFPLLPAGLKKSAEPVVRKILANLKLRRAEFEVWPALTDEGDPTWVFARYRKKVDEPWQWFDARVHARQFARFKTPPFFPEIYIPGREKDYATLFLDFMQNGSLYDKPVYRDTVWTRGLDGEILASWPTLKRLEALAIYPEPEPDLVARRIPTVARFNDQPVSFVIQVSTRGIQWPEILHWKQPLAPPRARFSASALPQMDFPSDWRARYAEDLKILTGEVAPPAPFTAFVRKNSADPQNQLVALAEYLKVRHEANGHEARLQRFSYRGIEQTNVIARIPGFLPPEKNRPILIADHIDTAFAEDTFERTGERVSVPGANDNVSAVAAILRMSELFRGLKPAHDIWFVHFTGEEYPADCLGARHFLTELLAAKTDIGGMLLMDMIGYREAGRRGVQLNVGDSLHSWQMARVAEAAFKKYAPVWQTVLLGRYHPKSYLYNTDGYPTTHWGFDVVFFNEETNRINMNHYDQHYHRSDDRSEFIDVPYATDFAKVVAVSAVYLADQID